MRINDWCYMSSWSWLNYWPNFLEGMNHKQHAWLMNNHADRTDGVDGWGSPLVRFVQKSLSPYLIQDKKLQAENPGAPHGHETGQAQWPYQAPYGVAGKHTEHPVEVFNGGLFGNKLTLVWSAQWDKPDGEIAVKGAEIACEIEPGFHEEKVIAFTIPDINQDQRKLYLVMDSVKNGKVVFHEEGAYVNVVRQLAEPTAVFLGDDTGTQGDWQGKYGADGCVLIGREPSMPAYTLFGWKSGTEYVFNKATDDKMALAYFANPPTGKDRVAAHRYGNDITFTFNTRQNTQRMSLYFRDYEKKNIKQEVEIADFITGKVLDKQVMEKFTEGCYKSWKVQGYVRVTIRRTNETIASVSGVFLDSLKSADH